jgi:muramoyltetrapeptide carboxypeptidase LdcA involved in peptidoglycan recycling
LLSLTKPRHLRAGDRLATVSPSWGGPAIFPHCYAAGKQQLEETFGVTLIEMPHTLSDAKYLAAHPEARAADLMQAFADPTIAGVVATIGGDDCIRLLPHLDLDVIRQNPKVFIGFSDTTALHLACVAAGLSSFYGPSIMAGFGENAGMHRYTIDAVFNAVFRRDPIGLIPINEEGWTAERLSWADPAAQYKPRILQPCEPPRLLQGTGSATGHLLGGCAEVLEMAKGTAWWPPLDQWRGAILFCETSEDRPSPKFVRYWLRNYAAQGILEVLKGILIARPDPPLGDADYQNELDAAFTDILAEVGLPRLPVLSGLDFGHTQPMLTLPYGAQARIDCEMGRLTVIDSGVS